MRPKSLILLVLALGCGLVAAIGINQVLANRPSAKSADTGEVVPIFFALTDIGLGDPLTPQVLKLEEWPKMKVPTGALMNLDEVEGRRAHTKFYSGEPIIEAKLFVKGDQGSGATDLIPKGYRVVSVKVDDVSGSGLILPGDRVDALVHVTDNSAQIGNEANRSSTHTFLHNVKVFAVNNIYSRESNGSENITAKTISLLVTPQQAELLTLASEMGKIRLVMRSADDDTQEETTGVMQSELFKGGDTNLAARPALPVAEKLLKVIEPPKKVEPAPVATTEPEEPADSWKMVLIEGNAVREVEFADGEKVGSPLQVREISNPGAPAKAPASGLPRIEQAPETDSTPFEPPTDDGPGTPQEKTESGPYVSPDGLDGKRSSDTTTQLGRGNPLLRNGSVTMDGLRV